MLRGWLVGLAILVGTGCAFAADANSSLAHEKRWEEARKLLAEGNAAEAKVAFEDLLGQYPNEPDLHLFLGITLLRLRDPQAAVTSIKRAIAINPNHVEARTLLGWVESEVRGDFNAAVKEYEKVVELRPNSAEAYNNLGVAEKRKGELDKAAAAFNKALERKPDYGAVHQAKRRSLATFVAMGKARCARCGKPICRDEQWDLGHVDGDPTRWSGPEHWRCNRATPPSGPGRRRVSRDW